MRFHLPHRPRVAPRIGCVSLIVEGGEDEAALVERRCGRTQEAPQGITCQRLRRAWVRALKGPMRFRFPWLTPAEIDAAL